MAINVQKVMTVEVKEWKTLIAIEENHKAEIIRLKNDYLDSKAGEQKRNRVTMQREEIARLEETLAAKKAQLARMRHLARNAVSESKRCDERLKDLRENLAARENLDRMLEMKSLFNAMKKAGITPPELGQTVTEDQIVS